MAGKAKPIPDGFHTITPHMIIRGAAKAIEFYKKAFGAEEIMRMPGPDGQSIMHAEIRIGDSVIMLNDEFPDWGKVSPQALNGSPVTIHLYVNDADAVFNKAVQAGATAIMPVADMFWGDRYGCLQDPFGHHWSVATHIADYTPEECMKRCQEAMGGACKPS
jgi:PhnB protein